MNEFSIISKSMDETTRIGRKIGEYIQKIPSRSILITLKGELGAGKTTLIKGISQGVNIYETVESPTFVFLTIHQGNLNLYHFDLYRLTKIEELDNLGFYETIDKPGIIVVEWGEKIEKIVKEDLSIQFDKISKNCRKITFCTTNQSLKGLYEYLIY